MKHFFIVLCVLMGWIVPAHAQAVSIPNDTTTGTTLNHLGKFIANGSNMSVVLTGTGDVASTAPMGVVIGWGNGATSGITGNALVATGGTVQCVFDAGGVTVGHAVINSAATAGDCKDGGAPPNVNAVGIAAQTVASGLANVIAIAPWGR